MFKVRKAILLIAAMLVTLAAAAKGELTFDRRTVDFGNVKAGGGPVKMNFTFRNTGDEPVGIVTVTNGGCGCTRPHFPTAPIRPGESGTITVEFNPATFRGEVERTVKVRTSAGRKRTTLTFKGVVIP